MKTQEKNELQENNHSKTPLRGLSVVAIQGSEENALTKWFFVSVIFHLAIAFLFVATIFCLKFFNIDLKIFPEKKSVKDIEFVLNSAAPVQKAAPKAAPKAQPAKAAPKVAKPVVKSEPKKAPASHPKATATKQKPNKFSKAKPKAVKSSGIPDFSASMPSFKSISSGLGSSTKSKVRVSGIDSDSNAVGKADSGFASNSAAGSYQGSSKASAKKAISTFDISPYISELRRDIKANWRVPSPNKRVDLFLRIAKDGRIVILNVKRTSEIGDIDNAALNAVKKCAPLNPLPSKYTKSYLDVVFVFDGTSVTSRR